MANTPPEKPSSVSVGKIVENRIQIEFQIDDVINRLFPGAEASHCGGCQGCSGCSHFEARPQITSG